MRLLGIDYGTKRLGIAICGALRIASPVDMIHRCTEKQDLIAIQRFIDKYGADKLVVGLPVNMDNSLGDMAKQAQLFAHILHKKLKLPVVLWDERLSSHQADHIMHEAGLTKVQKKRSRDAIAASVMLQCYVDSNSDAFDELDSETIIEHTIETIEDAK